MLSVIGLRRLVSGQPDQAEAGKGEEQQDDRDYQDGEY